jgi:C-terminal repeat of topoisomerase
MPPQTLEIRCPKTDQPVLATEKWFTFPGWPDVRCWKLIAKRTMKPEDFIQAFQNGRAELITGFQSKEGKAFDARLVYDAKAKNFSFAFEEKPPGQLVSLRASNTALQSQVNDQRPLFRQALKECKRRLWLWAISIDKRLILVMKTCGSHIRDLSPCVRISSTDCIRLLTPSRNSTQSTGK